MAPVVDPGRSWPAILATLMRGESLDSAATSWAMNEVMSGNATPVQIAAFAVLLRGKGETPEELAGLVTAMRERAVPVPVAGRAVDIVGTGGDRAQTVNISTMAAIVVAASGRRVVKHGNRAASSACGTADVLEELGVVIDLPAAGVAATVAEVGIGFCFATVFHPGMRFASAPRKELAVPTPFNFLGPLTNPARPAAAAIGCAVAEMAPVMAAVMAGQADAALVFRGDDGLDELTTTTTSHAWICASGEVSEAVIDPRAFGISPVQPERLRGGDRVHNAAVVRDLVAGGGDDGVRDAVLLNAAAGIAAYDGFPGGLEASLAAGIEAARQAIDSGAAAKLLTRWVEASRRVRDELS